MPIRDLLHRNDLEYFIRWCKIINIETRVPKSNFELVGVRYMNQWVGIFDHIGSVEHLSIDNRLERLVLQYLEMKNAKPNSSLFQQKNQTFDLEGTIFPE